MIESKCWTLFLFILSGKKYELLVNANQGLDLLKYSIMPFEQILKGRCLISMGKTHCNPYKLSCIYKWDYHISVRKLPFRTYCNQFKTLYNYIFNPWLALISDFYCLKLNNIKIILAYSYLILQKVNYLTTFLLQRKLIAQILQRVTTYNV